jgi:tRNA (uracil-5-)-methyltransferase
MQNELVITLIYDIPLSEDWNRAAIDLRAYILHQDISTVSSVSIIGRSRGQKLIIGNDFVNEVLRVNNKDIKYIQTVDGFSNPNSYVNARALQWIVETMQFITSTCLHERHHLLELYSGNSNHTCALAVAVDYIVAVEINKELCKVAIDNLRVNNIDNVTVVHLDSAKVAKYIIKDKCWQLANGNRIVFNIVLVDPPRAGLDKLTLSCIVKYNYIIYISCMPESFFRDLREIVITHDIIRFAVFDHFAYTNHVECGVFLKIKC